MTDKPQREMTEHTEEKLLEYLSTIAAALEYIRRDIHELVDERPKEKKAMTDSPFENYPKNLPVATYLDQVKAVELINSAGFHGHNDWHIPTLEQVRLQYANKDMAIGEPFITENSGSGYPVWYWSSTEDRGTSSGVRSVRFSDGDEHSSHKDGRRLSCRPVRLVAAPSLG